MPTLEPDIEALLIRAIPGLTKEWRGAPREQIEEIAALAGRPLPPFYQWFLETMGSAMGGAGYAQLDFSAPAILRAYREGRVQVSPPLLLIGYSSNALMPTHVFYDLSAPVRGDAAVCRMDAEGGGRVDTFETFREMLAWNNMHQWLITPRAHRCEGNFESDETEVLGELRPVLNRLGFREPVATGSYCGLFEREDAELICKVTPEEEALSIQCFDAAADDQGVLRRILGTIATETPLEVRIDERSWSS